MFQWLNEATGGSKQVSGSVDVNPDLFWYPSSTTSAGLDSSVSVEQNLPTLSGR